MQKDNVRDVVLDESGCKKFFTSMWFWGIAVVFLCLAFPPIFSKLLSIYGVDPKVSHENFAEQYSVLNAMFSGLAFAGVITALYFQRREIELQREELKLQRMEMRSATEEQELHRYVFERQQRNNELQRFDSSFSSLVRLMFDVRQDACYKAPKVSYDGPDATRYFFQEIKKNVDRLRTLSRAESGILYKTSMESLMNSAYIICRDWMIGWAMCLVHVERSVLDQKEKKFYFSYLEDVLDDSEKNILKLCLKGVDAFLVKEAGIICRRYNIIGFGEDGKEWWEV